MRYTRPLYFNEIYSFIHTTHSVHGLGGHGPSQVLVGSQAHLVLSCHPEDVLYALCEARCLDPCVAGASHGLPGHTQGFPLLHLVFCDGGATVVTGLRPGEVHTRVGETVHLEVLGCTGFVCCGKIPGK